MRIRLGRARARTHARARARYARIALHSRRRRFLGYARSPVLQSATRRGVLSCVRGYAQPDQVDLASPRVLSAIGLVWFAFAFAFAFAFTLVSYRIVSNRMVMTIRVYFHE